MTLNVDIIVRYTRNFTTHINRLLCVKKDTRKVDYNLQIYFLQVCCNIESTYQSQAIRKGEEEVNLTQEDSSTGELKAVTQVTSR